MSSVAETVDTASITRITPLHQTVRLEWASSNPIFAGWAQPGTLSSEPGWKIAQLNYDGNGNLLSVLWAVASGGSRGDMEYRHIWDNRGSISFA